MLGLLLSGAPNAAPAAGAGSGALCVSTLTHPAPSSTAIASPFLLVTDTCLQNSMRAARAAYSATMALVSLSVITCRHRAGGTALAQHGHCSVGIVAPAPAAWSRRLVFQHDWQCQCEHVSANSPVSLDRPQEEQHLAAAVLPTSPPSEVASAAVVVVVLGTKSALQAEPVGR